MKRGECSLTASDEAEAEAGKADGTARILAGFLTFVPIKVSVKNSESYSYRMSGRRS